MVTALLCAAPVPGDIGSCGQPVQRLDAERFFVAKKTVDCRRCSYCHLESSRCDEACDGQSAEGRDFPPGCEPLVHDGEVCLRRLLEASCADYADYVREVAPTVPSECDFCPPEAR